ncbi:MAG: hypothetical protein RMK91_09060 [Pseudanabaenaceae cyanobacterium SKYGB_i_bin29]|nr:hypothetical protein [Pseudanabaenaceae cyanobacterium SKYG29]MDW8422004.1 hypothetical protein [Pseudanabaenaceae cyanobacterium SKYGB_i_bin29]
MDDLTGISLGQDKRYYLQSLLFQSGLSFVYEAIDRLDESPKLVEVWDVDLARGQADFLERLQEVMQIQDNRLLSVVDGGILVIPVGSEILREVPYVVTDTLPPSIPLTPQLPLAIALRLAIKLVTTVHYLHSGAYLRSRSGQIIGQLKLSHGHLSDQSVWLDPDCNKLILRDWYRFWLLEGKFYPAQDVQDLLLLLKSFLPTSHRLFQPIWAKNYTTAKEIAADLRQCQLKLQPRRFKWYSLVMLPVVAIAIGFLLFDLARRGLVERRPQPVATGVITTVDIPPPVTVSPPPRPVYKYVPQPPREPQVYRIDFPTTPPPEPPPSTRPAVTLPPEPTIPRSTRPVVPPPPPPLLPPTPLPAPVTNPRVEIKPPPVPFVPPAADSEPVKEIATTIDANFVNNHAQLLQQVGERALVTIAGEFTNPNRQEVSMLVLATRRGRTAPIFAARVTREQWQADPMGASWANYMSRSSTLLGFSSNTGAASSVVPPPRRALTPSIQPLPNAPTQEEIEQAIQDRK